MTAPVIVLQAKVRLADPHDCTDDKDVLSLLSAVYETLIVRSGAGFGPALADAWTVSEDACVWTFRLRGGAVFHDGTRCDAAAVVLSLARMARPDKGYTLGAPGVWHQYLGGATIRAEDDRTVVVELKSPCADLLDILVQGFIAAPALGRALDAGQEALPNGSGPYRVTRAAQDEVATARVEDHSRAGAAGQIVWRAEPAADARIQAVRRGEAQVATSLNVADLETDGATTELRYEDPVAIIFLLNAARGPLRDPRIRAALNAAIDREALVRIARGGAGRPLYGLMPGLSLGAARSRVLRPDMQQARALLTEAGHGGGLTLTLDCPTRLPDEAQGLTQVLADQLAPLGVHLEVTVHQDRLAYAHKVRKKEIGDLCVFDSSPISTFRVLCEKIDARVAGSWWQGYHNPRVEAGLDQARATVDITERAAIYAGIIATLQSDPPWLTLYTPEKGVALSGRHRDFAMSDDGILDVANLPAF